MTTTNNGVAEDVTAALDSDADLMEAFIKNWDVKEDTTPEKDAPKQPAKQVEPEDTPEDEPETQETETAEDEETPAETEEATDDKERAYAQDEAYVKITVGEETHEVPVKQLSRLFGQEAALTQKSQQVAELRKNADANMAKATATLAGLLENAKKEFEPYSQLNFLALSKNPNVSAEELTALSEAAQVAQGKVKFLETELDGYMKAIQEHNHAQLRERALEAHKSLSDPDKGIKGWNQKLYDDIRAYAIHEGMDANVVNGVVDAPTIRMFHKAMMFDRGKSKTVTTVKNKTPTRVVKTSSTPTTLSKPSADKKAKAMRALKAKGSNENVANVFLAGWDDQS